MQKLTFLYRVRKVLKTNEMVIVKTIRSVAVCHCPYLARMLFHYELSSLTDVNLPWP